VAQREPVTRQRIDKFLRELGKRYRGAGRLYLTGGSQLTYAGFTHQTEDIDYVVQLEGDQQEFTRAVRSLIRDMNLSLEPAGPGDFIPLPEGWEDRSRHIGRYGRLDVFTFDPISTALSKIERGTSRDIDGVLALLNAGIISVPELEEAYQEIVPRLETEALRVDEADFQRKVDAFLRLAQE